jgi:hypothetical protein
VSVGVVEDDDAAVQIASRERPEFELCDNAKVRTTSFEGFEEVSVLGRCSLDNTAVGKDDLG